MAMFEPLRVGCISVATGLAPQAIVGTLGRKVSQRPGVRRLLQHRERRALWDTCRMPDPSALHATPERPSFGVAALCSRTSPTGGPTRGGGYAI
jgi:hypothetical protein